MPDFELCSLDGEMSFNLSVIWPESPVSKTIQASIEFSTISLTMDLAELARIHTTKLTEKYIWWYAGTYVESGEWITISKAA